MATESPLIHDGGQCVAAGNYTPGQGLSGVGGSGQFLAVALNSTGRTVAIVGSANVAIYGVLQNTPPQGVAADVGILGISKAMAGGTIAAGAQLGVNASGQFVTYVSGPVVGVAIEAAVSGQVFTMKIIPSN